MTRGDDLAKDTRSDGDGRLPVPQTGFPQGVTQEVFDAGTGNDQVTHQTGFPQGVIQGSFWRKGPEVTGTEGYLSPRQGSRKGPPAIPGHPCLYTEPPFRKKPTGTRTPILALPLQALQGLYGGEQMNRGVIALAGKPMMGYSAMNRDR